MSAYYWPHAPAREATGLDLTRLGGRLSPDLPMESQPEALEFSDPTHLTMDSVGYGHFQSRFELVFSPAESLARMKGAPDRAHSMIRIRRNGADVVRFGFKTRLCAELEPGAYCRVYRQDEEVLIAEATCGR